jgi:hypothetical protein
MPSIVDFSSFLPSAAIDLTTPFAHSASYGHVGAAQAQALSNAY